MNKPQNIIFKCKLMHQFSCHLRATESLSKGLVDESENIVLK